ncbi:universal stress protein [Methylocaldum sp.]|uniref:universal stress protein n=1 Tax=Methylocaldum sp. TaxID=1969727 RepID=UPI002D5CA9DC|nr:universal stress protein [Methylocaldum sp.]HYE34008.1 universal stress protein [Methylocaldum sp.]
MAEDAPISERVVVALNVLRHDMGMLELAAHLAARKQARLMAVYVEETNLINLAELPFAMEVDRICAAERKVDQLRLMRALRSRSEQVQQALYRLNESLQVDVSFKTVRGHFVSAVMSQIEQVDIVFLSRRCEAYRDSTTQKSSTCPIWVLFDGSRESERALQMAVELAELESSRLYIALPAKTDAESETLKRQTLKCCVQSASVRFVTVHPFDARNLLHSMRRTGCRLLVVKRQDGDLSRAISEAAACPVVLV